MFIKITKTHHRALDPRTTKTFCINDVHEFDEDLAQDFIRNGFAVEYKELKQEIENKAILEIPETKGIFEDVSEEELKEEFSNKNLEQEIKKEAEEAPIQKAKTAKTKGKK